MDVLCDFNITSENMNAGYSMEKQEMVKDKKRSFTVNCNAKEKNCRKPSQFYHVYTTSHQCRPTTKTGDFTQTFPTLLGILLDHNTKNRLRALALKTSCFFNACCAEEINEN